MTVVVQELYDLQKPSNQIRREQKVSYQKNLVESVVSFLKFRATKVCLAPRHFLRRALYTIYTTPLLVKHQAQLAFHNKCVCPLRSLSSQHQNVCLLPVHRNKLCCKDQQVLHRNSSSSFAHPTSHKAFA